MRKKEVMAVFLAIILGTGMALPVAASDTGAQDMYRLYNPNTGEHFYTARQSERNSLYKAGWEYEGIGWTAPAKSNTPVYRLYNKKSGDHHYTTSIGEKDYLVRVGWKDEGIGWYSSDNKKIPLYRQYNPHAISGTHNYTTSKAENDQLARNGWKQEGIGWYGIKSGRTDNALPSRLKTIDGYYYCTLKPYAAKGSPEYFKSITYANNSLTIRGGMTYQKNESISYPGKVLSGDTFIFRTNKNTRYWDRGGDYPDMEEQRDHFMAILNTPENKISGLSIIVVVRNGVVQNVFCSS